MTDKKTRLPIIYAVIIVLAVLAICFFAVRAIWQRNTVEAAPAVSAESGFISLGSITKITFTRGDTPISFAKGGDVWYYTDDVAFPVEQEKLNALCAALETSSGESIASGSLSAYGLSAPTASITLAGEGNRTLTLQLGSLTENGQYLLRSDDAGTIYLVDARLSELLPASLYEVVRYTRFPAVAADDITGLLRTVGEDSTSYTRMEVVETAENADGSFTDVAAKRWFLAGTALTEEGQAAGDAIVEMLSSLQFTGCTAYSAGADQLADYGFDGAAVYTFTYLSGQEPLTLHLTLGSTAEDGTSRYARLNDLAEVVLVPAAAADTLEKGFAAMAVLE